MTNKRNYKLNKKSIVAFLSLAVAAVLSINAGIITAYASNNNFSATLEINDNVVEPLPTPVPRTNKREPSSAKTKAPDSAAGASQRTTTQGESAKSGNARAARQGTTSAAASTAGSVPKPTGKNLSDRQKGNIKQLESDLTAIKQGSTVTPQQKTDLKNSLMAMADGATKPNPAAVQKLANDLSAALASGGISAAEQRQLAEDLQAVMNSANIPEAEIEKAIADAQAILASSGVDQSDVKAVVYDLQQIAAEARKNVESVTTKARAKTQAPTSNAKETSSTVPTGARRQRPE